MNAAIKQQQLSALRQREKIDGTIFVYGDVAGVGILSVPSVDAALGLSGPSERTSAMLTVRRAWFKMPPAAREPTQLQIFEVSGLQLCTAVLTCSVPRSLVAGDPTRSYLATAINADDPLAYEFTLLDRG